MTNLEAKQEAIKKAYGEHYDNLKKYLNGFMIDRVNYERETGNKLSDLKGINFIKEGNVYSYPDTVEGFKDNNKWIRIESEKDLPNNEKVWICDNNNRVLLSSKTVLSWILKNPDNKITHYQPIEKPKLPIY